MSDRKERDPATCPFCKATDQWEIRYRELRCGSCGNVTPIPFKTLARELVLVGTPEWGLPAGKAEPAAAPVDAVAKSVVDTLAPTEGERSSPARSPIAKAVKDDTLVSVAAMVDLPKELSKKVAGRLAGMDMVMGAATAEAEAGLEKLRAAKAMAEQRARA